MRDWRRSFPSYILSRGKKYCDQGKVKGLTANNNMILARVLGTHVYQVIIRGLTAGRLDMTCTCPYAADGSRCKHMAAVLFEYERSQRSASPAAALIRGPEYFAAAPKRDHLFFNMHDLTDSVAFTEDSLEEARSLIKEERIQYTDFSLDYRGPAADARLYGTMTASFEETGRRYQASVQFSRKGISYMYCPLCDSSYFFYSRDNKAICAHKTALLLLLDEYLYRTDPGDSTDHAGSRFLGSMLESLTTFPENAGTKRADIHLEPRIIRDTEGLALSFRIGTDRLYVLKDLKELVQAETHNESIALGKNTILRFQEQTFTEGSAACYDLIFHEIQRRQEIERTVRKVYYTGRELFPRGSMPLSGDLLDSFYDLYSGKEIPFQDKLARSPQPFCIWKKKSRKYPCRSGLNASAAGSTASLWTVLCRN